MSEETFKRMRKQLRDMFPTATINEIIHACNLISNEIRKRKSDIYEVHIHTHSMETEPGYHEDFDVIFGSGEYRVHVQLVVD